MRALLIIAALLVAQCSRAQTLLTNMDTTNKKVVTTYQAGLTNPNMKIVASANTTITIPANRAIQQVVIENTSANLVLGGLKIGTSAGASDVVSALAIPGNSLFAISDGVMLKKVFSITNSQTLYIQSVTGWNSATLNIYFILRTVSP